MSSMLYKIIRNPHICVKLQYMLMFVLEKEPDITSVLF